MKRLSCAAISIAISLSSAIKSSDTIPSKETLPTDPVLSFNDQEQLYVTAYQEFKPDDINPITTPIPRLEPMVRMHYSYVASLVRKSENHLNLLEQFWQQVANIIQEGQLTIANMRCITMQLALLITDFQKGTLREDKKNDHFYKLYQQGLWKELKNYNRREFYIPSMQAFPPHPFYCEAILCGSKGGFAYGRFVRNYLDRPFVLHLAALTVRNNGPHGGLVAESADYLEHDIGHNEMLALYVDLNQRALSANPETKDLHYWETFRSLLKKVNIKLKLNEIALSLMLREIIPSLVGVDHIPLLELSSQEMNFPFSMRKLFLCAVADCAAFTRVQNFDNGIFISVVYNFIENGGKKPWNNEKAFPSPLMRSTQQNKDGTFTGVVKVLTNPALPPSEGCTMPQQPTDLATFLVTYEVSPTPNPLKELVKVMKTDQLQWTSEAASHLSEDEKSTVAQDIEGWNYAVIADSRYKSYLFMVKDNENMLRSIYGEDCRLPAADAPFSTLAPAVDLGMKRFWRDFYLTNYHLFSDSSVG